jgi:hypothetical protein
MSSTSTEVAPANVDAAVLPPTPLPPVVLVLLEVLPPAVLLGRVLDAPPVPLVPELLPSQPKVVTRLASAAPTNNKLFVCIFGYLHRPGDSTIISFYIFITRCSNENR